jgi:hypothetical protein
MPTAIQSSRTREDFGAPPAALFAFREDWAALRPFFGAARSVPDEPEAFQSRYGAFADAANVTPFVRAVLTMHQIEDEMGGPAVLRQRLASNPDYLLKTEMPNDFYAHLVRMSSHAEGAAEALAKTFPLLESLLSPAMPAPERAASLRKVLAGPTGLAATTAAAAGEIESVRTALGPLTQRFLSALHALHQTQVVNQANVAIGTLESSTARLRRQADEAKEKAKSWFGGASGEKELLDLERQIAAATEELARKQAFVDGAAGFFITGNRVGPALARVAEKLRILAGIFAGAGERLTTVSQISNTEQLSDYQWLAHALDFPGAWQRWSGIEKAAREFVQGATVDLG